MSDNVLYDGVVRKARGKTLPGFEETDHAGKWKEPFFFVQAADTQLGMIVNYGDGTIGEQYPNITWDREVELCELSVAKLNSMNPKPAFFIVCGDLLDAFPQKWPDLRKAQERDFMKAYSKLDKDIPLVCVCGNHDVGNTPTPETVAQYKETFGDDYFSFWVNGVHFIVLNSQYYEDDSLTKDLSSKQEEWLDVQLRKEAVHKVLFHHIPWFVKSPEEEKFYFNIEYQKRRKMLKKFKDAGVRKIFCGHYHRNAGGWDGELELIVTSAIGCQMGDDESGMRIVKVLSEDKIEHQYYSLENCPTNINLSE